MYTITICYIMHNDQYCFHQPVSEVLWHIMEANSAKPTYK